MVNYIYQKGFFQDNYYQSTIDYDQHNGELIEKNEDD